MGQAAAKESEAEVQEGQALNFAAPFVRKPGEAWTRELDLGDAEISSKPGKATLTVSGAKLTELVLFQVL